MRCFTRQYQTVKPRRQRPNGQQALVHAGLRPNGLAPHHPAQQINELQSYVAFFGRSKLAVITP